MRRYSFMHSCRFVKRRQRRFVCCCCCCCCLNGQRVADGLVRVFVCRPVLRVRRQLCGCGHWHRCEQWFAHGICCSQQVLLGTNVAVKVEQRLAAARIGTFGFVHTTTCEVHEYVAKRVHVHVLFFDAVNVQKLQIAKVRRFGQCVHVSV